MQTISEKSWGFLKIQRFFKNMANFEGFLFILEGFWKIWRFQGFCDFEAFSEISSIFQDFRVILVLSSILQDFQVFPSFSSIFQDFQAFFKFFKHFSTVSIFSLFQAIFKIFKHFPTFSSIFKYFQSFWSNFEDFKHFPTFSSNFTTNEVQIVVVFIRFYYWSYFSKSRKRDENNPGYKVKDWYIERKHDNLKRELLDNDECLTVEEYDQIYCRATDLVQGLHAKSISNHFYWFTREYGLSAGMTITLQHIIAICVYSNFYVESKTCVFGHFVFFEIFGDFQSFRSFNGFFEILRILVTLLVNIEDFKDFTNISLIFQWFLSILVTFSVNVEDFTVFWIFRKNVRFK